MNVFLALSFKSLVVVLVLLVAPRTSFANTQELLKVDCPDHDISGDVYCRALMVSENPDIARSRKIPIRIMVLKATGDSPKADPLVIIPGGPGQSAISAPNLRNFFSSYFAAIRSHRDIILVDQRGVGGSNPLSLEPSAELLFVRTSMNLPPEWGKPALPRLKGKADLTQYTSARAVDDLDAVRQALGVKRINIYATSYGTRVAQYYIKRYGEHVRAAIFKGVSPPGDNVVLSYGQKPQRALDKLFAMCKADSQCNKDYPELQKQLNNVLLKLSRQPVPVEVQHPTSGEPYNFQITQGSFAFGIRAQMMNAFAFSRLPQLISQAHNGDFENWAQFLPRVPALYASQLYGGMAFSVIATEDVPRVTESMIKVDAEDTLIGDSIARGFMELLSFWPTGLAPDDLNIPLRTDVPILLVSGALDPATPPDGAKKMLPNLPNGKHIIFKGGSHSAANFVGLDKIMAEFISLGSTEKLDLSAVDTNLPPEFPTTNSE